MTDTQSQKDLFLTIKTAAGEDIFIMQRFKGTEQLSDLFEFRAEIYSMTHKNPKALSMDFSSILQKNSTISIAVDQNNMRYFNGIVTDIFQGPTVRYAVEDVNKTHEKTFFTLTIRPKLWLLTLQENCRIFQNKSTIAIIKSVLGDGGITLEDKTSKAGSATREYCVQYNESDFAFISRLMEAEGIGYFFTHTDTDHTLVLFDTGDNYVECANASEIKCLDPLIPGFFGIQELNMQQQIVSGSFTTTDFDYENPTTSLKSTTKGQSGVGDVYHYPGNYKKQADGQTTSDQRQEIFAFQQGLVSGTSNVPYMMPGNSFKLLNSVRTSLNGLKYVFFKVTHHATYLEQESEADSSLDPVNLLEDKEMKTTYYNTFSCFPGSILFKPDLKTPRPRIYGTQTAVVTGKDQEEIWTDKYGRVLVKFPWDLSATKNEETSCWIRVMQHWTGQNWGMQFTPRIGQEVVVTFLNGDPDYPLITGCVYNGTNLPPYLPAEPTKSTIKTNSSKGGGGYNELRFEDKKDSEELYARAQKDFIIDVINGNRTTTLQAAKGDAVIDTLKIVKGDRIKTLTEGNETITLTKGNRSKTLTEGNETITLTKGKRDVTLTEGDETLTLSKGDRTVAVTGKQSHNITKDCILTIGGDLTIKVTGNIAMEGKQFTIKCSTFELDASTSVTIKATTTAEISAQTMTVKGEAQATFQSSAMVNVKGAMATVEGSGMASLKGGMVNIG